jgi:hypothetical protein
MINNVSECVKSISIATAYITMMRKTTRLQIGVGLALVELQDVEKVPLLQEGGLQGGRLKLSYVVGKRDNVVGEMSSVWQKKPFDCVLSFTDDDQVSFYPVLIDQSSYCSEDIAFGRKNPQYFVFPRA